jgi:hypothetical protein
MRGSPVKVAVHGSYFANNFGDTLLVKLMCDWVARRVGTGNVFLAVPGHPAEQDSIGYPVIPLGERHRITHLVYTGGGHFGEPRQSFWENYRWQRRNRKRHLDWLKSFRNARKAVFGVGVGPISNPFYRHAVRQLFKEAEVVFVRDEESLEFSRKYRFNREQLRLGTDLAMSIGPVEKKPERLFALHVAGLPRDEIIAIIDALTVKGLIKPDSPVDIIFDGKMSEAAVKLYENSAGSRVGRDRLQFIEYTGIDGLIERISNTDLVLTNKLHVGVVATALGRKVISLPAHQKTSRFYRQLGLNYFCLQQDRRNAGEICRVIERLGEYKFDREAVRRLLLPVDAALDDFLNFDLVPSGRH